MKTTKENIELLIDKLADKTLSFGCEGIDDLGRIYISSSKYGYNNEKIRWCYWEREDGETQFYPDKILGHPIMIGDVLERLKHTEILEEITNVDSIDYGKKINSSWAHSQYLIELWGECGFNKSLQQIIEESEYLSKCNDANNCKGDFPCTARLDDYCTGKHFGELKDKNARNLCEFLLNIFKQT